MPSNRRKPVAVTRRQFVAANLLLPALARAGETLRILGGAQGGAFLPYALGLASRLGASGFVGVEVHETAGSIANLGGVAANANSIGLAFLPAYLELRAETGASAASGLFGVRALFPMYRATYQVVARANGPSRFVELDGLSVGVGPRGGSDAAMFGRVSGDVFVNVKTVYGSYAELADGLVSGVIEALWVGAGTPTPAIAAIMSRIEARVFGLSAWEIARLIGRNPIFSAAIIPVATYSGQRASIASVAAWNFVVANEKLPEESAYAIVRAALEPFAGLVPLSPETLAAYAAQNRVIPFHPGALRYYRSVGLSLP